jgi:ankyrin repeat protein
VEILVNNKAIVNHCDEFGNSALHLACHNMHGPVIMYLGNAGI